MKNSKLNTKTAIAAYAMLVAILFCGCNLRQNKGEDLNETNDLEVRVIKDKLTYIKDDKTGLCFAVLNNTDGFRNTFAITCVPCDSLKRVVAK